MKSNEGKEASYTFVLCLLILIGYVLPVVFKSFFVNATGRIFLTSKESILLGAVFVFALVFDIKPIDQVIMVVSGAIFLFLLFIVAMDLFFGQPHKIPGLLLLLVLHGSIFLLIYDSIEPGSRIKAEKRDRAISR